MMSTQYPVLNDRPINLWKVVELKEELKRRKLMTKGLKEDLIRRLDEAIRKERGIFEAEVSEGVSFEPRDVDKFLYAQSHSNYADMADEAGNNALHSASNSKVHDIVARVDIDDDLVLMDPHKIQEEEIDGTDSVVVIREPAVLDTSVGTSSIMNEVSISQIASNDEAHENTEIEIENKVLKSPREDVFLVGRSEVLKASLDNSNTFNEIVVSQTVSGEKKNDKTMQSEDLNSPQTTDILVEEAAVLEAPMETSRIVEDIAATQIFSSDKLLEKNEAKLEKEGLKPLQMDAECDASGPGNQVLEVSPSVGFKVKSDSISTNTVSIHESKELNDNLIAGNMHLELEIGKSEIVQLSSRECPPNDGSLLSLDDHMSHGTQSFVGETNDDKTAHKEFNINSDCADGGSSATSKLDHDLFDDPIAEDVLENKPFELNLNPNKVGNNTKVPEIPIANDGSSEDDVGNQLYLDKGEMSAERHGIAGSAEERKLKVGDNIYTDMDHNKTSNVASGEHFQKINLEQSSSDDSPEDEVLEMKDVDTVHIPDKVGEKIVLIEVPGVKVRSTFDAVEPDFSSSKVDPSPEKKNEITAFCEKRKSQVGDNISTDMDHNKTNNVAGGEHFQKINLEQSLADDSPEDEVLEMKNVDSVHIPDKVGEKIVLIEVPGVKVRSTFDAVEPDFSSSKVDPSPEKKDEIAVFCEKRKSQDEAPVEGKGPPKRHRRNFEGLNSPEQVDSGVSVSTTTKDLYHTTVVKHNFMRSGSTCSGDAPKEVPPSSKPPTNSLRIDHFLRPFTLKAVQELLAKTGNVCSFWMDHIKTHCYVTYSAVEEAVQTRNAVYNLQWPPNGGRLLVANFVDPQEVKLRLETRVQSATAPVTTSTNVPAPQAPIQPPPSAQQLSLRQHLPTQPPPSLPEEQEPPMVTLDDLFRKTRATPRIYYLPLTDEQVAAKIVTRSEVRH